MNEFEARNIQNGLAFNNIYGVNQNIMLNNRILNNPEAYGYIRPVFNELLEENTEQMIDSSDLNFPNSIDKNIPVNNTPYGFDRVVDVIADAPKQETVDGMSIDYNLDREPVRQYESVGLPMDGLIRDNPIEVNPEYIDTGFNSLISDYTPNYDLKFGVQAIPVDIDRSMLPKPVTQESLHPNKDDKPSGRKISNWFTRLIDQRGEEYLTSGRLTIEEVSKNAERIIDDMIAGRIDYDKFGKYLIMPVIIETLINYCSNKLAINRALQFSLGYIYNDYIEKGNLIDDPERYAILSGIDDSLIRDITQSIAIVNQDITIYSILYNRFCYVNNTKNVSNLYSLINELNSYKKQMRKRY